MAKRQRPGRQLQVRLTSACSYVRQWRLRSTNECRPCGKQALPTARLCTCRHRSWLRSHKPSQEMRRRRCSCLFTLLFSAATPSRMSSRAPGLQRRRCRSRQSQMCSRRVPSGTLSYCCCCCIVMCQSSPPAPDARQARLPEWTLGGTVTGMAHLVLRALHWHAAAWAKQLWGRGASGAPQAREQRAAGACCYSVCHAMLPSSCRAIAFHSSVVRRFVPASARRRLAWHLLDCVRGCLLGIPWPAEHCGAAAAHRRTSRRRGLQHGGHLESRRRQQMPCR